MIAGNKVTPVPCAEELYSERIRLIKWYERNHIEDFSLYGVAWDRPAATRGLINRSIRLAKRFLWRSLGRKHFPSYRGRIHSKVDVLKRYKFSFCFENVRDHPGYVTEKIFDSMMAGCVPVYLGAQDVADLIPKDCFVDYREYDSISEMHDSISSIREDRYRELQYNMKLFLTGNQVLPFSKEHFADFIVARLRADGVV